MVVRCQLEALEWKSGTEWIRKDSSIDTRNEEQGSLGVLSIWILEVQYNQNRVTGRMCASWNCWGGLEDRESNVAEKVENFCFLLWPHHRRFQ